jgi:hypothetical protein
MNERVASELVIENYFRALEASLTKCWIMLKTT